MNTLIGFTKGAMSMRMPTPLWMGALIAANGVAPLFFWSSLEAKVVLITFLASATIMVSIYARLDFVRLLGLGHILWIPLVIWLSVRLGGVESSSAFAYWILAVMVLNSISLVIDIIDVIRYVRGERDPFVDNA
jgi:hypothetical protein